MRYYVAFAVVLMLTLHGCDGSSGGGSDPGTNEPPSDSNTPLPEPVVPPVTSNPPPQQPSCPDFRNPSIYPSVTSPFICGQAGIITNNIMSDINTFWGSQMFACSCSVDQPQCQDNALVYGSTPFDAGFGYIYYDPTFLERLQVGSNSFLPPAWLLSHEAGHNIQSAFSVSFPAPALKELSADCFSGYFLGNLVCKGETNAQEIDNSFRTLCSLERGVSAFFNPNGHGSCAERVDSISHGINSYLGGVPPLSACL